MKRVGLLTLNKNVDNFFNENEQLAFSVAHVVPGERARASAHPPCESCTPGRAPLACAVTQGIALRKVSLVMVSLWLRCLQTC